MFLTFITYSSGYPYDKYALNLLNQAKNQFDEIIHFNHSDIEDYKKDNENIWRHHCDKTGDNKNGFWIWKPYIISLALNKYINKKDHIIVYCDAKYSLIGNLYDPIKKYFTDNQNEYLFNLETHHFTSNRYLEVSYSKGDAFKLIGVDMNENDYHSWAGFLCVRCCDESITFINDWIKYCRDESIVTDIASKSKNHIRFIQNRYDQTVFSLLLKKYKIYPNKSELSTKLSRSDIIHRVD